MSSVLPHRPGTNDSAQGAPASSLRSAFASSTPSSHSNSNGPRKPDSQTSLGRRFAEDTSSSSQPKSVPSASSLQAPKRRLKSQYPADSPDPHVEYILVASFHVDRGPIMEHQYPDAISGDEHMLAELMLPDQTHVRAQDWTMFFLHKDTGSDDEGDEAWDHPGKETDGAKRDDENDDEEQTDETDDAPLMYVLNLVNTKQDTSAKRGAVVKSMAVCTRHPFLHIYKPLLLLALEDYFKSPFEATLSSVYNAVNSMDLSLMPRLSYLERHILQATDRKDMFAEKFEQMIDQRVADEKTELEPSAGDPSTITSSGRYAIPRDTHEFESKIVYNDIAIPVKVPTAVWPETVGDFSLIKLIQIFSSVHASSPQPFSLHPHLTSSGAYTHPIIVLANAIFTQKRVIFLGHNRPSSEVAEAVLAACSLASGGVLRGFTRHAFPYTDLTKVDELLKVPGFVAGVTNPAFANHHEWWDLMCDLPSGRMKISSRIEAAPATEGTQFFQHPSHAGGSSILGASQSPDPTGDNHFMDDVLRSISSRHGEGVIRAKWRAYVTKFTRISAAFEEAVYGATALYVMGPEEEPSSPAENRGAAQAQAQTPAKNSSAGPSLRGHGYVWADEGTRHRDLAAWVSRVEGWRNTRSYYHFIQDTATLYLAGRPVKSMDVHHHHDRLRVLKLPHAESGAIYLAFNDAIRDYNSICQLLSVAPESQAGLFYVSMGLFHPHTAVRDGTVELLDRVAAHGAGRHFWAQLSRFLKLGYLRAKQDLETRRSSGQSQSQSQSQQSEAAAAQESKAARVLGNSAGIPKGRKS